MTKQDWIAIAAITASFINTLVAAWLQRLRAQEVRDTATPATNQPKARIKRFIGRLFPPWLPWALFWIIISGGLANSIYALLKEVGSQDAVSRQTVLTIAFHIAALFTLMLSTFVAALALRFLSSLELVTDVLGKITADLGKITADTEIRINTLTDIAENLQPERKSKKHGLLD